MPEKYFHIAPNSKDIHVSFYDKSDNLVEKTTADKPVLISKLPHTNIRIEVELSLDGSDKNLVGVGSFYVTNDTNGISMPVLNTGLQQVNTHWAKVVPLWMVLLFQQPMKEKLLLVQLIQMVTFY